MKIKVKSLKKNSTNVNKRITTTESEGPIKKFKVSNTNQFIECVELQIWVNGSNIAEGCTTSHSSIYSNYTSSFAVDGLYVGDKYFHSMNSNLEYFIIELNSGIFVAHTTCKLQICYYLSDRYSIGLNIEGSTHNMSNP